MNNLELSLKQRLSISNKIITSLEIMSLNIMELSSFLEKDIELIRKSGEKIFNLDSDIGNKFNQSTDE